VILIVDDDPEVRFMLTLWLEELGHPFEEATSGEQALERCAANRYQAIVLDQRMPPGMSGLETARTLRNRGNLVPIVLHSAYLQPDVIAEANAMALATVEKGDELGLLATLRDLLGTDDYPRG
jgi:CheY-like chemotaxis protein